MRWNKILQVVDCHAEGESGQVIVGGVGDDPRRHRLRQAGLSAGPSRRAAADDLVRAAGRDPPQRQHPGARPTIRRRQMGYVILESTEYPAMSGSNTICVATVLLETGILPMTEPTTELTLESPAGLITVTCRCRDGKVERVRFVNQPAFCYYLDADIEVPGLGRADRRRRVRRHDLRAGRGGAGGLRPDPGRGPEDLRARPGDQEGGGRAVGGGASRPTRRSPGSPRSSSPAPCCREGDGLRSRNAVVVSPGRLDRSPCGTGTSARLAASCTPAA